MTRLCTPLSLLPLVICILLAAGCVGHQEPVSYTGVTIDKPDINPPEKTPPFDSIRTDADIYNVGEVVEFYTVNESPGTGRCADHPCSYRVARLVKNESWQVLRTPLVTMLPYSDSTYYEPSCQPMHFATTNWIPGRYRIQYRCGVFQEFGVREMPMVPAP